MSKMFADLIKQSKLITRDEFAANFGGIADDVVEMLESDQLRAAVQEARSIMEEAEPLPNGSLRLRNMDFGLFSSAPELERGEVAAVDGTPTLPMQMYSAGQALCVGVASLSHRRPMQDTLHYWSSKILLQQAKDSDDFIAIEERGLFGISQSAYLRYFEAKHALDIKEEFVFFDGTLVYEWLVAINEGVALYDELFASEKKCLGVMKSIKSNPVFTKYARAIKTGEVYVVETLEDHLNSSNVTNKNHGETAKRGAQPGFRRNTAPHILRGIFKPQKKVFGFEVHEDHLEDVLRIMAADCQLNNVGHEIPFLLNRVDEEVRRNFNPKMLQDRISLKMAVQSEELFFEETNERSFR